LSAAPRRSPLELVVPVVAGATVFAFAAGSSSVAQIVEPARAARWVAVLVLLAVAAAWALERRNGRQLPPVAVVGPVVFVGLALVSAAWSVTPRLSVERAVSFALLIAAALAVAVAVRGHGGDAERVLLGIVGGAVAVALAGVVTLAAAHDRAVVHASIEVPSRYQGFGENPNTAALLYAVAIPLAVGLTLNAATRRRRAALLVAVVFLLGSTVASGSRGSLAAAALGSLVVIGLGARGRTRVILIAAAIACAVAGAVIQSLPEPLPIRPVASSPTATAPPPAPKPPRFQDAEAAYPLSEDIGKPLPGGGEPTRRRRFFGGSGRGEAWLGTLRLAEQRPLLGYGFGTEQKVFVDRYYAFVGGSPENTYIGIALQLGAFGLLGLLGSIAALLVAGRPALRSPARSVALACLGAVTAGLTIAVVQSYIYSAGSIAAASFWIPLFLLPALAFRNAHG
jgi:hypothetical protein